MDNTYFDETLKIHAICADLDISEDDTRTISYVHLKIKENNDKDYFLHPLDEDSQALEIMLDMFHPVFQITNDEEKEAARIINNVVDLIGKIDNCLKNECGMENRLSGELKNRLKLYKDNNFKNYILNIYKNKILTKFEQYNNENINKAFQCYKTKKAKEEQNILDMLK